MAGDSSYVDPNPAATNTWHFTDSSNGNTYSGTFSPLLGGSFDPTDSAMVIFGAASTEDTLFVVGLKMPTGSVIPGIYGVAGDNAMGLASTQNIYYADATTSTTGDSPSYVTITSYDAATKRLTGSFHCWAVDPNGNITLIKGSFNCVLT